MSAKPRHRLFERHIAPAGTWDRDRIIAAIRAWHAEVGDVPRSYDWCPSSGRSLGRVDSGQTKWEAEHPRWPGSTTVYRYFGSWSEAVQAAGLPPRSAPRTMPLVERVIRAQQLHAEGLPVAAIAEAVGVSTQTARRYLQAHACATCAAPVVGDGDLCQPCTTRAANPRRWERQELLDLGKAWIRETGRLPVVIDWASASGDDDRTKWKREFPRWPPASVVTFAFGSWTAFRIELGGEEYNPSWAPEEILDAIERWVGEHGRPPTKTEWERPPRGWPSAPTVRRRFGSFRAGLEAAGFQSPKPKWDEDTLIAAIRHFRAEHGRAPQPADWRKKSGGYPQTVTVQRYFGSWEAALQAARTMSK